MNKFILTAVLAFIGFVGGAFAQETNVGLQYTRVNPSVHQPQFRFDRDSDSLGAVASVTSYQDKNQNIGLTGEGSAVFNTGSQANQLYTALGGLTVKSRHFASFQPFVKGAAGLGAIHVSDNVFGPAKSDASVAFKASLGADVGKGKYKWRLIEVGYLQTHFFNQRQDNLVLSTGLTF